MTFKKKSTFLLLIAIIFSSIFANAQNRKHKEKELTIYEIDTLINPVPMQRSLFFDKVKKQQNIADAADGKIDKKITINDDELGSTILTQSLIRDVNQIQIMIENLPFEDKFTENQTKLGYHRSLENVVIQYNNDKRNDPYYFRKLVQNFRGMIVAKSDGEIGSICKGKCEYIFVD